MCCANPSRRVLFNFFEIDHSYKKGRLFGNVSIKSFCAWCCVKWCFRLGGTGCDLSDSGGANPKDVGCHVAGDTCRLFNPLGCCMYLGAGLSSELMGAKSRRIWNGLLEDKSDRPCQLESASVGISMYNQVDMRIVVILETKT